MTSIEGRHVLTLASQAHCRGPDSELPFASRKLTNQDTRDTLSWSTSLPEEGGIVSGIGCERLYWGWRSL